MKTLFFLFTALLLFSASVSADDFSPTLLTLDVPAEISYKFDGSTLDIPVTVSGTPAAVWLVINTHDKGDEIGSVRNGHLGWHYVNNIDTTVYISPRYSFSPGDHVIEWDGTSSEGGLVESGAYDYYLWGYDDQSDRQMASNYVMMSHDWLPPMMQLHCFNKDKLPLPNPVFFGNPDPALTYEKVQRWYIGADPNNNNFLEETVCRVYRDGMGDRGVLTPGFSVSDRDSLDYFYQPCRDVDNALFTLLKWTFVVDGDAILHEDWGGWDSELVFECPAMIDDPNVWARNPGLYTDFNYLYCTGQDGAQRNWNYIYCVSFDGDLVFARNHEEFHLPDDANPDGAVNGFPYLMDGLFHKEHHWVLWGDSCLQEMVDYTGILNGESDTHTIVWQNGNGDFFFDHGHAPDSDPAWFCIGGSSEESERQGRHSSLDVDSMGFNIWGTGQLGLTNFGVSTQDGTGIGYMHFADETVGDQEIRKGGGTICDNGGAFDGMYWHRPVNNPVLELNMWAWGTAEWIGMDNFEGTISNEIIGVETDDAQAEFSISQNSPNPFNPVTTIGYSIPEETSVSLKIYTISGQLVVTLIDRIETTGQHSVTWDASGQPSGVYLYTFEAGNYSETRKMTLVK